MFVVITDTVKWFMKPGILLLRVLPICIHKNWAMVDLLYRKSFYGTADLSHNEHWRDDVINSKNNKSSKVKVKFLLRLLYTYYTENDLNQIQR